MSHFVLQNINRVKIYSLFETTAVNNFEYVAAEIFLKVSKQILGTKGLNIINNLLNIPFQWFININHKDT